MSPNNNRIVNLDDPQSNETEEYSTPIEVQGMRRGRVAN